MGVCAAHASRSVCSARKQECVQHLHSSSLKEASFRSLRVLIYLLLNVRLVPFSRILLQHIALLRSAQQRTADQV